MFNVYISGGGIGGLTCAVALSKYPDIDVDVYEAGSSFIQNGPGCGTWLRTWNILQKLGLDQDLAKITGTRPTDDPGNYLHMLALGLTSLIQPSVSTFSFRKSDRAEGIDFLQLTTRGSWPQFGALLSP